jgi:uncharacterized protein
MALVALAGWPFPLPAQELEVPFLSGRVVDEAGIIPPEVRTRIEEKLARYEADTGHQVAVLTVPSLEGAPVEDYALRVAETWKLGREGVDDGVLFLVSSGDRRMRLEVGYGLEPELTDLEASRILDEQVAPRFRQGDFGGGIEAGVDAVVASLEGAELPPPEDSGVGAGGDLPWGGRLLALVLFAAVVGTFSLSAMATEGCMGWGLYAFLMPFYLIFPSFLIHPWAGPAALGLWALGFPAGRAWMRRRGGPKWLSGTHGGSRSWRRGGWIGGGGFGGGFGGGGGGFSGGGGSFGGGGASGSW